VISFIYGRLIKKSLMDYARGNCINIHPAPLPQYRGLFPYNFCILNQEKIWGVTAHFISEEFDKGDIIKIETFPVDSNEITLEELVELSSHKSYDLLVEVINDINMGKEINRYPQGEGTYYSRKDFEEAKIITAIDTADTINRKIRAFWYPPYEGAYIRIDNEKYCLINTDILKQLNMEIEE
jgi:methionyl-tRNA formyltransferase